MRTLLPCLILFLLYLLGERIALGRSRRRIPLCIAVTGTRGKSGVARMLAAVFRADGRQVLAKTTGSEAVILLPDGSRIELDRSTTPSIVEQKKLVKMAARLRVDCLIVEVMSIRPENHYFETQHILRPDVLAITNVRKDHMEFMGVTEDAIASVLSLDIGAGSTVFLPVKDDRVSFRAEARRRGAALIPVESGGSAPLLQTAPDLGRIEFSENLDLISAIARHFGINEQNTIAGIRSATHDVGKLGVWLYPAAGRDRGCFLVNAFAANDPDSTFQVLSKVTALIPNAAERIVGILNLRSDRAARTLQWISALQAGALRRFERLFVTGDHSRAVRRRLPAVQILKAGEPEEMMATVCASLMDGAVVFGFGNVKGAGRRLAEHWSKVGTPYA